MSPDEQVSRHDTAVSLRWAGWTAILAVELYAIASQLGWWLAPLIAVLAIAVLLLLVADEVDQ